MLVDLNIVQQTDLSDMHGHSIPLNIPYLTPPWWRVVHTFIILVSKLLNAIFHKDSSFVI